METPTRINQNLANLIDILGICGIWEKCAVSVFHSSLMFISFGNFAESCSLSFGRHKTKKPNHNNNCTTEGVGWGISSVASPSLVYGHALGTGPLLGQAHSWDMPLVRAQSQDRPTFGTGPFLGQTHSWDRPTLGTGPFLGQAYSWDRPTRLKINPTNPNASLA
jgi:hypothetical protein